MSGASKQSIEVLLYGLGAIGSFYAFILSRSPKVRLSVCARSNYDAVSSKGIYIDSFKHGQHTFHPHRVLRQPSEAKQAYDYVLCCNKAVNMENVTEQLRPVVDEARTTVAIMQNGVGNEVPFRKAFPGCTIVSGVVSGSTSQHIHQNRALLHSVIG
jgi:ketopantoate reductase